MKRLTQIFFVFFAALTMAGKAQEIDSILAFGDSYFDTGAGNAVSAQFGVPLVSPTPPYFAGRHSNGLIWIDYTTQALGLSLTNFAVAGAETGAGNVNSPPPNNPIGGLFQQLARFEATGKRITDEQLVVVDGAGNNFLALVPTMLNPAAVQAAAAQALTDLGTVVLPTLQKLGAQKIVLWNLGDLSMLPLFNSPVFGPLDSPLVRELMHGASVGFNAALIPVVQELNSELVHFLEGVNSDQQIFIFDAFSAFNTLAAELVAEGKDLSQFSIIANYGGPYLPNPLIPPGTDPNSLPFYDQVHPTTVSWALFSNIISAYLDTLINAPRFVAAQTDIALETASAHRDVVENHFRTLREERYIYDCCCCDCCNDCCCCCCDCCNCYDCCCNECYCCDNYCNDWCGYDRFQLYIDTEAKWGSLNTRKGNFGFNYNTQLGLIGLDYRLTQNLTAGASFTYQRSHARIREHRGSLNLHDYIPTIYATYLGPCYFVDFATSLHCYQFRNIKRNIPFLDRVARGRTHSVSPEINFDAGFVGSLGCLTYMPIVGFSYEDVTIDRYHERCAGSLNMRVHRHGQRSCIVNAGGQLFYRLWNDCRLQTLAFAELFYQHECLRGRKRHGMTFANSVDNAVDFNRTSRVRHDMIKYSLGISANFDCNLVANISYIGDTNFKNYSNAVRAQVDYSF